ncbi:MAG: gamma carbonic anhydrase family protein [Rhodospirillaceae bacterium]|nr:gamma carbonic anhydrase family protein [Rhodospirillaceae bacterium]
MPVILPYRGIEPEIDKSTFIAATATITGDVKIGKDSSIWYGCTIRGDVNKVNIGSGSNIQDGTVVHVSSQFETKIGNNVTIGHMALIHACTIEDGCFIGMKACIMDGCVVEKGAMLAAGALLTPGKRIPAGELWAGSPAKFMRKIGETEIAMIEYTAPHYVKLAREYIEIEMDAKK